MTYGAGSAATNAGYSIMVQAAKASGAIIRVDIEAFSTILTKSEKPLVVISPGGLFSKGFQYLTAYKGLIFYAKSSHPLDLPGGSEVVNAKQIWIPG